MFKEYLKRTVAMPVVEAVVSQSIDRHTYEFLADVRKFDVNYDNEDIYFILNEMDEAWTKDGVDETLKLSYEAGLLTPKLLKKYVKTVYDGIKLSNVKINDWNDISFTVKFTEPRMFYWRYKRYQSTFNFSGEDTYEED